MSVVGRTYLESGRRHIDEMVERTGWSGGDQ